MHQKTKFYRGLLLVGLLAGFVAASVWGQTEKDETGVSRAREEDYYKITSLPIPAGIALEVGGLTVMPDGRLAVSTRRGEVWLIQNPEMQMGRPPAYRRFAHGLHEALGIAYQGGSFYVSQRGELTRLTDTNGDDQSDQYHTVFKYPLTGNYHEYAYGPIIHPNGDMTVTLNVAFGPEGYSGVPWRGWMLQIKPDGSITPFATGMRSPAGIGLDEKGEIFYSDNQGDWVGSSNITHVAKGDFTGNPGGLPWASQPNSPVKVREKDITSSGRPMHEVAKEVPGLKTPAIWFPHGIMGNSTSGILLHTGKANMGPFDGQLFVGDQAQSRVMRASLEQVKGVYQGACYPFREGFASGVLRQDWGNDGSMYVGMTSRGWASTGPEEYALQRLSWNGKVPFEMHTVTAKPDGFELLFTKPVDKALAQEPANYAVTGFTYKYHSDYGSPVINQEESPVKAAVVSEDGLKVRLVVDNLREGYIHEIKLEALQALDKTLLLHDVVYYTLNQIPEGEKLAIAAKPATNHQHNSKPAEKGSSAKASKASTTAAAKKESAVASAPVASKQKHTTKMPASWEKGPDQTIILGTKPGLKFDKTVLEVKAGSRIKLVFNNTDDMQHNFVLALQNKANEVGEMALNLGLKGPEKQYVPDTPMVLYHTSLLQPTSAETIYFTAPSKHGEYPYVCTYPGHYTIMRGIMKVVN